MTATKLTGAELLTKTAEMEGKPKAEIVQACGYYMTKTDGSIRYNFTDYYEAMLDAKGIKPEEPTEVLYEVSVPVYITVAVYRQPGLTKEEVLKSVTWEDCNDFDGKDIACSISNSIEENNDVQVFDENQDEVV